MSSVAVDPLMVLQHQAGRFADIVRHDAGQNIGAATSSFRRIAFRCRSVRVLAKIAMADEIIPVD